MCPGSKGEQFKALQDNYPGLAQYIIDMEKYLGKKIKSMEDKGFLELVERGKRTYSKKKKDS